MKYHHIYPNFFSLTPPILPQICLSLNLCSFVSFDNPLKSLAQSEWNTEPIVQFNLTVGTSTKGSDSPSPGNSQLADTSKGWG